MPQGGKAKGSSSKYQQFGFNHPLLKCRFIQAKHRGAACELPVARDGGTQEMAGCVQGEILCSSTLEKPPPFPREPAGPWEVQSGTNTQPSLPKAPLSSALQACVRRNSLGAWMNQQWLHALRWALSRMAGRPCPSCLRGQAVKVMLVCWPVAKREVGW